MLDQHRTTGKVPCHIVGKADLFLWRIMGAVIRNGHPSKFSRPIRPEGLDHLIWDHSWSRHKVGHVGEDSGLREQGRSEGAIDIVRSRRRHRAIEEFADRLYRRIRVAKIRDTVPV